MDPRCSISPVFQQKQLSPDYDSTEDEKRKLSTTTDSFVVTKTMLSKTIQGLTNLMRNNQLIGNPSLFFAGRRLKDKKKLSDYNIKVGYTLYYVCDSLKISKGEHCSHDAFIRDCLLTDTYSDYLNRSFNELQEALPEEKNELEKFVSAELQKDPPPSRLKRMALYIMLHHYPNSWFSCFEAADDLLVSLLQSIEKDAKDHPNRLVYPPCWTQQVFCLENALAPNEIKGLIFGIDPMSKGAGMEFATGYAFVFNFPEEPTLRFLY
jgi:hypothetical protein